ncbi:MAG: response regulator [Actinomycetota bacterium]
MRVLYLDDNPSNVKLMRMVLSLRADVELSIAADGAGGIEAARAEPPDLMLIDLYLPDMRGDEVLRELNGHEATAQVPTIVVSAEDDQKVVRDTLRAGADAYVTKPFKVTELLDVIDKVVPFQTREDAP